MNSRIARLHSSKVGSAIFLSGVSGVSVLGVVVEEIGLVLFPLVVESGIEFILRFVLNFVFVLGETLLFDFLGDEGDVIHQVFDVFLVVIVILNV